MRNEIEEIERKMKRYKMEIKKLNNLYVKNMNNIINYIDNYILLYKKINKSIDNFKNYESIKNLDIIKNKKLIKDIDEFLNGNIKYKYKQLIDFIDNTKNEMTIIYKNNDDKIRLFGKNFI